MNRLKNLTAPKKTYFGDSLARMEDLIARQHTWRVLLSAEASQQGKSIAGKRAANAEKRRDARKWKEAPRPENAPKVVVPSSRTYSKITRRATEKWKTGTLKRKRKEKLRKERAKNAETPPVIQKTPGGGRG